MAQLVHKIYFNMNLHDEVVFASLCKADGSGYSDEPVLGFLLCFWHGLDNLKYICMRLYPPNGNYRWNNFGTV